MKCYSQSVSKRESNVINEDAAIARNGIIAVSDGAGGGGVFAELWSNYLLSQLPARAIRDYQQLDAWVDGIWEPYYKDCEIKAKQQGSLFLNKFYDEGSFATLAAVWFRNNTAEWMTYGDSVVFCYNFRHHKLQHSDISLALFNQAPYLIGSNAALKAEGFHSGRFAMYDGEVFFAATDALSHYILMMYELAHAENYQEEINEAVESKTKNSNLIKVAENESIDFENTLCRLLYAACEKKRFILFMSRLEKSGLLAHDDYSLAVLDSRQTNVGRKTNGYVNKRAFIFRRGYKVMNLKTVRKMKHQ